MRHHAYTMLVVAALLAGCGTRQRVSTDSDYNYALVFFSMRQPKPVILNSRLEQYSKDMGLWTSKERNGEWEFEVLAPKAWVDEVKTGFLATTFNDTPRHPSVSWWKPTEGEFDVYQLPFSSYSAAHLYVEKHPSDESRIHVFIQRH